jgi:hypothetical protein
MCFVDGFLWHIDPATGQHWLADDSDAEMSEAEVEAQVAGVTAAPEIVGTGTGTLETEDDILEAARALVTAEVRQVSSISSVPLIIASRNLRNPVDPRPPLAPNSIPHPQKWGNTLLFPKRKGIGWRVGSSLRVGLCLWPSLARQLACPRILCPVSPPSHHSHPVQADTTFTITVLILLRRRDPQPQDPHATKRGRLEWSTRMTRTQ